MKKTQNHTKYTRRRKISCNRKNQKKTYRKTKMSNKSRKSNRLRKGGNGPLNPDTIMPHVFGNLEYEITPSDI